MFKFTDYAYQSKTFRTGQYAPSGPRRNDTMLRIIFLNLMALVPSASWADDDIRCNHMGNQLDLIACARDDFNGADTKFNKAYQALINKKADDKLFITKLRLA
jgi:hypothetical protein